MSTPSPLNYAPRPPAYQRKRFRSIVALFTFFTASVWLAPRLFKRVENLYWQHRCLSYTAPVGQVVFDKRTGKNIIPFEWTRFYTGPSPAGFKSQGTIFLHELKRPDGAPRLVAVDFIPPFNAIGRDGVVAARTFSAGTLARSPSEQPAPDCIPIGEPKFIFAGQPDSADPTHFTFKISDGDAEQIYDGWLNNQDHVIFGERRN